MAISCFLLSLSSSITAATKAIYIRDWGEYDLNYYFCDACRYCFSAEKLPDRCPDCGAQTYKEKPAVRLASKMEIEELLRIRKEDKENTK